MRTLKNLNRHSPASIVREVHTISAARPTDQLSTQVDFIPCHDLLQNNRSQPTEDKYSYNWLLTDHKSIRSTQALIFNLYILD